MDAIKAKAMRSFLGDSQDRFAKRIGVAASTICAIEKGQRDISNYIRSKLIRLELELPDDFFNFYLQYKNYT